MLSSPGGPIVGWPGVLVMAVGAAILLLAIVHAAWKTLTR
jgi:hypothetical protein